jgi:hypothetical protein
LVWWKLVDEEKIVTVKSEEREARDSVDDAI